MSEDKIDVVQVILRMDERLHRQLVAAAQQSERSRNGEIIWRLRSSFEQQSDVAA
jgi:predicted HicB family RNase H-like nuclease